MSSLATEIGRLSRSQRTIAREAAREAVAAAAAHRGASHVRTISLRLQILLAAVAVGELALATVMAVHTL